MDHRTQEYTEDRPSVVVIPFSPDFRISNGVLTLKDGSQENCSQRQSHESPSLTVFGSTPLLLRPSVVLFSPFVFDGGRRPWDFTGETRSVKSDVPGEFRVLFSNGDTLRGIRWWPDCIAERGIGKPGVKRN